jgi:anti-anti-sigma factor
VHIVASAGELDLATADGVQRELGRVAATDARSIILDLSGVTFMDQTVSG